jgi:hypothetical protein
MNKNLTERIENFKKRIEIDSLDFCLSLFEYSTTRLLAFKYAYYILSEELVKDQTYDAEEKSWYIMGRALDMIKEDETSPCIDFNFNHPLANDGIALAKTLLRL